MSCFVKVAHFFRQMKFVYLEARKGCGTRLDGKELFQVEKMQISGKIAEKVKRMLYITAWNKRSPAELSSKWN